MSVTCNIDELVVGGIDSGGLAMFYHTFRGTNQGETNGTHELELGFACRSGTQGLDALLVRLGVVEPEEGLQRLDALDGVRALFYDLERQLETLRGPDRQWDAGLFGQFETARLVTIKQQRIYEYTYTSVRIPSAFAL